MDHIDLSVLPHCMSSSSLILRTHLNVRALRDVGERQQLAPFLASALAVLRSTLLRLDVYRIRHYVLQLHELHAGWLAAGLPACLSSPSAPLSAKEKPAVDTLKFTVMFTFHDALSLAAARNTLLIPCCRRTRRTPGGLETP